MPHEFARNWASLDQLSKRRSGKSHGGQACSRLAIYTLFTITTKENVILTQRACDGLVGLNVPAVASCPMGPEVLWWVLLTK